MDAKDQRIAELEAEVQQLHAALEASEVRIKKKVRLPTHRHHSIDEVIQRERDRHLAELFGGLKLVGVLLLGAGLFVGAIYLTDYLVHSPPATYPPPVDATPPAP